MNGRLPLRILGNAMKHVRVHAGKITSLRMFHMVPCAMQAAASEVTWLHELVELMT